MPTIAIYARKSKFSQRSESVATQITLCREHCDRLFPGAEYIIYDSDEGYSGKNTNRPGFQRLMEDIKSRKVQVVCVYRLDRISRSVGDFCQLLDTLRRYHTSFVSLRENFDTTTPMGRAMIFITSIFSQLERETLAERVRDNIYELAKTGRWLGGQTPTGFDTATVDNSRGSTKRSMVTLVPDEEDLSLVRNLYALFCQFGSLSKLYSHCLVNNIRSRNGIPFSRTTLRLILTNPVYCTADAAAYEYFSTHPCQLCAEEADFDGVHGIMPFNRTHKDGSNTITKSSEEWIIAVGGHPGVLPGAQWVRVQQMLEQNKELGKAWQAARTETALLSGVIHCAHCGSPMRPKVYGKPLPDGSRRFHYICTRKIDTRGELCSMPNAPGNDLDRLVISQLSDISSGVSTFTPDSSVGVLTGAVPSADIEQQISKLEKDIASAQRKIDNLVAAIAEGAPPQLRDRLYTQMAELQQAIEKDQQTIAGLNASLMDAQGQQALVSHIHSIFSAFDDSFSDNTYDARRRLIRSVVDSVTWDGENVTIDILGAKTLPK